MTYADIIVDISHEKLDKSFQYLVPEKLKEEIQVEWWFPFHLEEEIMCARDM